MNYHTFQPHSDLAALIKCYWTLEVPAEMDAQKQRIVPDGCIEMIFTLGDDIKRFTNGDEFIIQPKSMILGQIVDPLFIQPIGDVNSFAVRFYPYGFANFSETPLKELANKETPIDQVFGKQIGKKLEGQIVSATNTEKRIAVVESFLLDRLKDKSIIDNIVKDTIDTLFLTNGSESINSILKDDISKRRNLERKFVKQVGLSPKQLSKVIRLQTAINILEAEPSRYSTELCFDEKPAVFQTFPHFTPR